MSQFVGWLSLGGDNPEMKNALRDKKQELNEATKLASHNNWEIARQWVHSRYQKNFFFNLYDSNKKQWSVRFFKYNDCEVFTIKNLEEGFFDPETTEWKPKQVYQVQRIVDTLTMPITCGRQIVRTISKYRVEQAWVSTSQKKGVVRYFVNVINGEKQKFYAKIHVFDNIQTEVGYAGQGWVYHPPMIPFDEF